MDYCFVPRQILAIETERQTTEWFN